MKSILTKQQLAITIRRLANQVLENNDNFSDSVIIGIQPRGIFLSDQIVEEIKKELPNGKYLTVNWILLFTGMISVRNCILPIKQTFHFLLEGKKVVLIDDVLYTGRTIRAALDALLAFGRPEKVELCVLIDRRFSRQFPIQPDYVGKSIDSIISQKVKVEWDKKEVVLY